MSDVVLITKVCRDCGEEKPSGDFHRNRSNTDGLNSYCKPCTITRTKASAERQRAEMGEQEYLAYRARIVRESRRNPAVRERTRLATRVQTEAYRRLRNNHPDEYEHLLAVVWSEADRGEFT